jgi:hypothetical protein
MTLVNGLHWSAERESRPRETQHPDAGDGEQDFVMPTELTKWTKEEPSKKQSTFGCVALSASVVNEENGNHEPEKA